MKSVLHGDVNYLRYVTVWNPLNFLLCLIASFVLYKMWKQLGGDTNFSPPDPDECLSNKAVKTET